MEGSTAFVEEKHDQRRVQKDRPRFRGGDKIGDRKVRELVFAQQWCLQVKEKK